MRLYLSFGFVLLQLLSYGQTFDTLDTKTGWASWVNYQQIIELNFEPQAEDSALSGSHRINPIKKQDYPWGDLGQYFSPSITYRWDLPATGAFQLAPDPMRFYKLKSKDVKFYHSSKPRTDLYYGQGTSGLIFLDAEISRNVSSTWDVGFNYKRVRTQNLFYDNLPEFNLDRMTNVTSAQAWSRFSTRDHKYEVLMDYSWNKMIIRETGGIQNASGFDTLAGRQKLFSRSAFLADASNLIAEREIHFTQFLRDGTRKMLQGDSLVEDTTYNGVKAQWFHDFRLKVEQFRFTDRVPSIDFYPVRRNSLTTEDSIRSRVFSNRLGRVGVIDNLLGRRIKFTASILYELIDVNQINGHKGKYSNFQLAGNLETGDSIRSTSLKLELAPIGFYQGDQRAELTNVVPLGESLLLETFAGWLRHRPDYNLQFFASNNYYWNQRLNKNDIISLKLGVVTPDGKLGIRAQVQNNNGFVYVDESGVPDQLTSAFNQFQGELFANLVFWNRIHFKPKVFYQNSGSEKVRIPQLSTKSTLYLEGNLFKGNMLAQLGGDIWFMTEFQGYDYDPATRLFKLGNNPVGGYPMIDVFLNMQVKTMNIFVLLEHATSGMNPNDWYTISGYPNLGRAIRFGAKWRLSN